MGSGSEMSDNDYSSQTAMRLPDTIVLLLWSNTGCGYRCIQLGQNCLDATIMGDVVSTGLNHGCG